MTNKQIIIDGVDVSGCRYLFDDTSYKRSKTSCSITLKDCKYLGNNCHYKKLKLKEQSETRLVKQIQTICDFINNRPEIFKGIYGGVDKIITEYAERKEQECEKLKKQLFSFMNGDYCTNGCSLKQQLEQLKQTLTEIKKIVHKSVIGGARQQILRKISEVME